jgi:hypothetical protein
MRNLKLIAILTLTLAVATSLPNLSEAYKFPGDDPSLGSAVATKIIGQFCSGTLSQSESAEINAYIDKATTEWSKNEERKKNQGYSSLSAQEIVRILTQTYSDKYKSTSACDDDAAEEARDTLGKVRNIMAAGGPTYPDESDPTYRPNVGAAITAKVTGEKCKGTLTALQLAQLQYFIARTWLSLAKTQPDSEVLHEMDLFNTAERNIGNGWRSTDCTPGATTKAKNIATHVAKELATVTP